MLPLLPLLFAGAAAFGFNRHRKNIKALESPAVKRLDARAQGLIQRHLDPLLMGRVGRRELMNLPEGDLRPLSAVERAANRSVALGVGAVGLLAAASLTALPIVPLALALGIISAAPLLGEAFRVAVEERRLSIMHLLLAYIAGLWLVGHYLLGVMGLLVSGVGRKIALLTQTVANQNQAKLSARQPERVFVRHGEVELEIPFRELKRGDILELGVGQVAPVDGTIITGVSFLYQHHPDLGACLVNKGVGDTVSAGTLVLNGPLQIQANQTGLEALTLGLMQNHAVPPHHDLTIAEQFQQLEWMRLPMVLGLGLGWLVGGPALALVMVGANVLVGVIPLRLLVFVNRLDPKYEQKDALLGDVPALVYLPAPDPHPVAEASVVPTRDSGEMLRSATPKPAAPSARPTRRPVTLDGVLDTGEPTPAQGWAARSRGRTFLLGSERFLADHGLLVPTAFAAIKAEAHAAGHSLLFVARDAQIVGAIALVVRHSRTRTRSRWLKRQPLRVYLLAVGDEAPRLGCVAELGVQGYAAATSPEQLAAKIQELQSQNLRVCFVGDGRRDAIALRQADAALPLYAVTTADGAPPLSDEGYPLPPWCGFLEEALSNQGGVPPALSSEGWALLLPGALLDESGDE